MSTQFPFFGRGSGDDLHKDLIMREHVVHILENNGDLAATMS
jgi:hypothetical protein